MLNLITWFIAFTGLVPLIYVQSVIVVNTECDDILNFYADGVEVSDKNITNSTYISIPDSTGVVAVTCRHIEGPAGIRLTFSNGIKTDHVWKCYNKSVDGWHEPGFNDDAWPNAVVIRQNWIWTAGYPQDDTVYCRTVIALKALTGQAACENIIDFYADGVLYKRGNFSYYDKPATIRIPGNTQLFAIQCRNIGGPAGIKLTLSNGVVTSATWKCYNTLEEGWNKPEFNDDTWPNAVVVKDAWIWTAGYPQDDIVYCRKGFANRTVVDSDNSPVLGCSAMAGIAFVVFAAISIWSSIILLYFFRKEKLIFAVQLMISNSVCLIIIGLATYFLCKKPISTGAVIGADVAIYVIVKITDLVFFFRGRVSQSSNQSSNQPSDHPTDHPSDRPSDHPSDQQHPSSGPFNRPHPSDPSSDGPSNFNQSYNEDFNESSVWSQNRYNDAIGRLAMS